MRTQVAASGLALILALTGAAACGSQEEPKATPSPSAKPTAPPGLVAQKPERSAGANTKEADVEYGYFFAGLV